jgi:hypothetical protein
LLWRGSTATRRKGRYLRGTDVTEPAGGGILMEKLTTKDGWRKSTRSGSQNPKCVEVRAVTDVQSA